jgi:hypothetical protein
MMMDIRELALELISILADKNGYAGLAFISDKDFTPLQEYINIYKLKKEIGNGNSILYVVSTRPLDNEEMSILHAVSSVGNSDKVIEAINDLLFKWNSKIEVINDELYLVTGNYAKICYDLAVKFNLIVNTELKKQKKQKGCYDGDNNNNKHVADSIRTTYTLINNIKITRVEYRDEDMFNCVWFINKNNSNDDDDGGGGDDGDNNK